MFTNKHCQIIGKRKKGKGNVVIPFGSCAFRHRIIVLHPFVGFELSNYGILAYFPKNSIFATIIAVTALM